MGVPPPEAGSPPWPSPDAAFLGLTWADGNKKGNLIMHCDQNVPSITTSQVMS
jgi:hypothetical protein